MNYNIHSEYCDFYPRHEGHRNVLVLEGTHDIMIDDIKNKRGLAQLISERTGEVYPLKWISDSPDFQAALDSRAGNEFTDFVLFINPSPEYVNQTFGGGGSEKYPRLKTL